MAFFLLQQSAESVVFVLHWPSDGSRNRSRESVKDLGGGGSQGGGQGGGGGGEKYTVK